jgi:hypothetical protein
MARILARLDREQTILEEFRSCRSSEVQEAVISTYWASAYISKFANAIIGLKICAGPTVELLNSSRNLHQRP